jgi:propanol-preferring alcohol dehydrogenase
MGDVPSFRYELLWEERMIRSVANLTRWDGHDFLVLAAQIPVETDTRLFPLHEANEAMAALRKGEIHGAAVLVM